MLERRFSSGASNSTSVPFVAVLVVVVVELIVVIVVVGVVLLSFLSFNKLVKREWSKKFSGFIKWSTVEFAIIVVSVLNFDVKRNTGSGYEETQMVDDDC